MMLALLHNWNPLHIIDNLRAVRHYGLGVRFELPAGANAAALRKLRRYGVRTYCYGMRGDLRTFRVSRGQAGYARALLNGMTPRSAWADKDPRAAVRPAGWQGGILGMFMGRD